MGQAEALDDGTAMVYRRCMNDCVQSQGLVRDQPWFSTLDIGVQLGIPGRESDHGEASNDVRYTRRDLARWR